MLMFFTQRKELEKGACGEGLGLVHGITKAVATESSLGQVAPLFPEETQSLLSLFSFFPHQQSDAIKCNPELEQYCCYPMVLPHHAA